MDLKSHRTSHLNWEMPLLSVVSICILWKIKTTHCTGVTHWCCPSRFVQSIKRDVCNCCLLLTTVRITNTGLIPVSIDVKLSNGKSSKLADPFKPDTNLCKQNSNVVIGYHQLASLAFRAKRCDWSQNAARDDMCSLSLCTSWSDNM